MDLEKALQILGGNYAKCHIGKNKNQAFSNREDDSLSVCFRYTKMYDGNIWWASESPLTMDSSDCIIIALQHRGLLVIPRNIVMQDYWNDLNISTLKNGRRNIRIKEEDGKLILYNGKKQATVDVMEYLLPCEVTD